MNKAILNERLVNVISRQAKRALEGRQVAQRLKSLLPLRYRDLRQEVASGSLRGAKADRMALTDPRYISYVEELVDIRAEAMTARIEYETHVMLYQARQTLRVFKR